MSASPSEHSPSEHLVGSCLEVALLSKSHPDDHPDQSISTEWTKLIDVDTQQEIDAHVETQMRHHEKIRVSLSHAATAEYMSRKLFLSMCKALWLLATNLDRHLRVYRDMESFQTEKIEDKVFVSFSSRDKKVLRYTFKNGKQMAELHAEWIEFMKSHEETMGIGPKTLKEMLSSCGFELINLLVLGIWDVEIHQDTDRQTRNTYILRSILMAYWQKHHLDTVATSCKNHCLEFKDLHTLEPTYLGCCIDRQCYTENFLSSWDDTQPRNFGHINIPHSRRNLPPEFVEKSCQLTKLFAKEKLDKFGPQLIARQREAERRSEARMQKRAKLDALK